MILVHFQGKSFSIIEIQVYASNTNAKEAEDERFYEDLQDILELTPEKNKQTKKKKTRTHPFHHKVLECKSRKSKDP